MTDDDYAYSNRRRLTLVPMEIGAAIVPTTLWRTPEEFRERVEQCLAAGEPVDIVGEYMDDVVIRIQGHQQFFPYMWAARLMFGSMV